MHLNRLNYRIRTCRLAIRLTGKYKIMDLFLGVLPILGTVLLSMMREDSGWIQTWFSIVS